MPGPQHEPPRQSPPAAAPHVTAEPSSRPSTAAAVVKTSAVDTASAKAVEPFDHTIPDPDDSSEGSWLKLNEDSDSEEGTLVDRTSDGDDDGIVVDDSIGSNNDDSIMSVSGGVSSYDGSGSTGSSSGDREKADWGSIVGGALVGAGVLLGAAAAVVNKTTEVAKGGGGVEDREEGKEDEQKTESERKSQD